MTEREAEVRGVLRHHRDALLMKANVVATGVGYKVTAGRRTDRLSIACSVVDKMPLAELRGRERVPSELDGVPTDVIQSGRIVAQLDRTARHRPAPGGVSVGHFAITAGTLGCLVRKGATRLILSNNHVLANSNDATLGDAIYQPGPHDGGGSADRLATLEDFVPIHFSEGPSDCPTASGVADVLNAAAALLGSRSRMKAVRIQQEDNLVDAAVARPLAEDEVLDEIAEVGPIQGLAEATLGLAVQKSGRTTGLTRGEILQVDVTVDVGYGGNRTARFSDQLMAGAMSQGGDSGSALLDEDRNLVGLLFAGSDQVTIFNRIQNVLRLLDVMR